MYADFIYPEYEVVRNYQRCIACRACERQCANEVHRYDADEQMMTADDAKCVNCHRCVSLCPTRALKIVRTDHTFKENANWTKDNIQNVYRQAATGGVLLSSMGNPEPLPGYWDRILINASQVTNPPIDPLREPMETVVLLSKGKVDSKKIRVEFSLEDMDMSEFQDGATYPQIKEYVLEHTGLKVSNLYISQIKRKCGIGVGKNYNLPKSEDSRQPQCPPEKEKAIREAFKYFGMI